MRIALVGPTHPHTGGIAHHATELAHRLSSIGHDVDLITWSSQYPAWLHPGTRRVQGGRPEVRVYPKVAARLSWWRPDTWWRTGSALRRYDAVVLIHATTVQVPAYFVLAGRLRGWRRARIAGRPRLVIVVHNVMPHERHPGDVVLTRALLGRADALMVHSTSQSDLARALVATPVRVLDLPPHPPLDADPGPASSAATSALDDGRIQEDGLHHRLLFFGTVRPYKGLASLLGALAQVPDVELVVAGDFWTGTKPVTKLIDDLGLTGRVQLRPGYVDAHDLPSLFAGVDALVLPYRAGSASQNVDLAFGFGVPVIATKVGTFPDRVQDGVDGLLVEPDSVEALVGALRQLYSPGTAAKLRAGVRPPDSDSVWAGYVKGLTVDLVGPSQVEGSPSRP